jgi:hypothetical protein
VRTSVTSLNRNRLGGSGAGAFMGCDYASMSMLAVLTVKPAAVQAWDASHTTGITPRPLVSQRRSTG